MKIYRTVQTAEAKSPLGLRQRFSRSKLAPNLAHPFSERILNQLAASAAGQQQLEQALVILNELVARFPRQAKYYCNRGLIYLQSGQPLEALADFNQAIHLSDRLDQAFNNRANCHAALGNPEAAIADYRQAIDLNPFNIKARINLAITLRELEQFDAALTTLEEALLFHQLSGQVYAQLGRTYHLRGDWNVAIANYRKALFMVPVDGTQADRRLRQQVRRWWQQLESVD